ncbi:hypothetical protein RB195_010234 [Necator americanus]|uniref:Anaphase-promoting complex subunit 4 WD40 domain-containing protein n=1 Tax=Necator americanus TaxID=51031 RepID=A0ABR1CX11_NECAM
MMAPSAEGVTPSQPPPGLPITERRRLSLSEVHVVSAQSWAHLRLHRDGSVLATQYTPAPPRIHALSRTPRLNTISLCLRMHVVSRCLFDSCTVSPNRITSQVSPPLQSISP